MTLMLILLSCLCDARCVGIRAAWLDRRQHWGVSNFFQVLSKAYTAHTFGSGHHLPSLRGQVRKLPVTVYLLRGRGWIFLASSSVFKALVNANWINAVAWHTDAQVLFPTRPYLKKVNDSLFWLRALKSASPELFRALNFTTLNFSSYPVWLVLTWKLLQYNTKALT